MFEFSIFNLVSVVVVSIHSFLNFQLCRALSDKTRFPTFSIYIVCLINGVTSPILIYNNFENPMLFYVIFSIVLAIEVLLLFDGKFFGIMGVALGSILHLTVLRAIVMAGFSLHTGHTMSDILASPTLEPLVNLCSFSVQIITLTLFIKLMPLKTVREIMDNKSFYKNLLSLTSLLVIFMVYNTYMFTVNYFSTTLAVQEIVMAFLVLAFFYIMILLLIKIFNLGIYKEKNKELEVKIDKERSLSSAVFNYASIVMEVNCSKDRIERLIIDSIEQDVSVMPNFMSILKRDNGRFTHADDIEKLKGINSFDLIASFENGIYESEYEYRSLQIISTNNGLHADNEEYLWYKMRVTTRLNNDTKDIIAFVTIEEIHDEKEEEIALRLQAETDPLTGAYNKLAFTTKLNALLEAGHHGTLYMFDLDNFKGINDNMGHSAGDEVLKEVYAKIYALFRSHDFIGRIGGDEFVVFLAGTDDIAIIEDKAKRICNVINKTYKAENKVRIEISSSIGVAIAPKDGKTFETLFNAADLAMYASKNKGKNTYTIYDEKLVEGFHPQEREAYMRLRDSE